MKDELRDNLIALFVKRGHKGKEIVEMVREIEALRCVWTWEGDISLYSTSCGDAWPLAKPFTFCPRCGKRIEVKEVEDGHER